MQPTIRPFTPEDYPATVAVTNAATPEYPRTVEEVKAWDARRDPKCKRERWVAEQNGQVVGVGMYDQSPWAYHPRRFSVFVAVHPEQQCRGIGAALYDRVVDALAPFDPIALRGYLREDMTRAVRFAAKRGYVEDMREWESRLDVAAFDPAPFAGAEERVRAATGVTIKTVRELAADPDRDRKLYELDEELLADVPSPDKHTPVGFEHWVQNVLESPNHLPDALFVAVTESGDYVGVSSLWKRQADNDLDTGLTGVRRSHRRRGIALALKLRAVAYAREHGHPTIRTENETNNRAMLSINEALGFVKQPAWLLVVKKIKDEPLENS